jgi:chromosome partitioning protein
MSTPQGTPSSASQVIAVCNQKGGVGKSTIAMALASCTAQAGGKALVVDIDPQGSATDLTSAMADPGYDVVPETDPRQLASIPALRSYDLVLVDCPGSLEGRRVLEEILAATSFAVIPYDHEPPSWQPTLNTVRYVTKRGVPCAVLLNNLDPRLGAAQIMEAWQSLDAEGIRAFATFVRQYRAWPNALRGGVTIGQYKGKYAKNAQEDIARVHRELRLLIERETGVA